MPGKETKDDEAHDSRTVFVRNLSYDTTDAKLEACFSDIGPIKEAFVVAKPGDTTHRGFGFVVFAIKEDAERAVKDRHLHSLDRRQIKVELAKKRAPLESGKMRGRRGDDDGKAGEGAPAAGEEQEEATKPAKAKKSKKAAKEEPSDDNEDEDGDEEEEEEEPSKKAKKSEKKKDGKEDKEAKKDKKGKEPVKKSGPKWEEKVEGEDGEGFSERQRRARTVAVGGLSEASRAAALRKAGNLGRVETVEDPAPPAETARGRLEADGCTGHVALVVYASVKDAQKAATSLHGRVVAGETVWARQLGGEGAHLKKWRVIIRNLAFKATREQIEAGFKPLKPREVTLPKNPNGQSKGFAFAGFCTRADAEAAVAALNGKEVGGRPVAVDWAVSKKEYAEAMQAGDKDDGSDSDGGETGSDEGSDDEDEEEGDGEGVKGDVEGERQMMRGVLGDLLGGKEGGGSDDDDDDEEEEEGGESEEESEEEEEEEELAPARGKAKVAELERPALPAPTGATTFIVGLPPTVEREQLEAELARFGKVKSCRLVLHPQTKRPRGTAFADFEEHEGAAKAVKAASKVDGVMVLGKSIGIKLALDKNGIRKLAGEKAKAEQENKDKRNIYLAQEGQIEEGTPAYEAMSASDRTKRARAVMERRSKLANPNFFVSPTRVLIRNVPSTFTERQLASLCVRAVKRHATKQDPRIVQCKILTEEGSKKSKGRGFVEFGEHQHALVALRQLNNNPEDFSRDARPIVEFAIENTRIVKQLDEIRKKRAGGDKGAPGATGAKGEKPKPGVPKSKLGKRERERAKRRAEGGDGAEGDGAPRAKRAREGTAGGKGEGRAAKGVKGKPGEDGKGKGKGKDNGKGKGKGVARDDDGPRGKRKGAPEVEGGDGKRARAGPADGKGGTAKGAAKGGRGAVPPPSSDPPARAERGPKPKKAGDKEDNLDKLVKQYRQRFFGGEAGGGGKGGGKGAGAGKQGAGGKAPKAAAAAAAAAAKTGAALSRWFD